MVNARMFLQLFGLLLKILKNLKARKKCTKINVSFSVKIFKSFWSILLFGMSMHLPKTNPLSTILDPPLFTWYVDSLRKLKSIQNHSD